ncbi:hypothetical protein H5410_050023 [Solanum commersonii]|uniref:Uncharacterized protein n=1 Tax=Solanum commersonii TaxID=4109 RepID=A0A9J5WWE4_SOLCO|nr:hypothetical protein H5410_050023 [Solanum commersonii]
MLALNGRFLCASSFVSTAEIGNYYQHNYPEFKVNQDYDDIDQQMAQNNNVGSSSWSHDREMQVQRGNYPHYVGGLY